MKTTVTENSKTKKAFPSAITSTHEYDAVMTKIDELMNKGSEHVNKKELAEIRKLALKAQAYERELFSIDPPTTLAGIVEMKMYELKLKQNQLAKKLNISDTKLSMIMSGKQKPDISFLKAVHKELMIDANVLLEAV